MVFAWILVWPGSGSQLRGELWEDKEVEGKEGYPVSGLVFK